MTVFRLKTASTIHPNTFLFPTLPLELREQIYHHALLPHTSPTNPHRVTISASDAVYNTDPRYPTYLPRLCRVNTTMRIEVGLWFIRNTEFGLLYQQYLVYLSQFLSTFPNNAGFAAVRRLDFQAFGRNVPGVLGDVRKNEYIAFMKKCDGLSNVRIKFEIWYLLKYQKVPAPMPADIREAYKLLSLEDIVDIYGLQGLFELQNLRTLHVEVWPKVFPHSIRGFFEYIPNCWPVMERLVEWVREEFDKRGMKVDVRLVESGNSGMRWTVGRVDGIGVNA